MVVVHYSYKNSLIVIPAFIETQTRFADLAMLLDTGCSHTIISPAVLKMLNIPMEKLHYNSVVRTAITKEYGRLLKVKSFKIFGRTFVNHTVDCHSLPSGFNIDGLIGMDILSKMRFAVDPFKKTITVE